MDFNVDPKKVQEKEKELTAAKAKLDAAAKNLQAATTKLKTSWQGAAQQQCVKQLDQTSTVIEAYSKDVNSFIISLQTIRENYQNAEKHNAAIFGA